MDIDAVVVDLDGTVYLGDELLAGAREAIETLRARGYDLLFVTNNPTRSPAGYVDRLADLGVEATASQILSAGTVTAEFLADRHADESAFVIGSDGLLAQLDDAGVTVTEDPERADVLVTSHSYEFDYEDLTHGLWALDDDTAFYGTDRDLTYPNDDGREYPGSGAITRAVAGVAEREPDRVLGKPSGVMVELIADRLARPERCCIVGDSLDTDIALGERAGMTTVLVLSGRTDHVAVEDAPVTPDYVLDALGDLPALLDDRGNV
ncbi:HAD-IIA family hydrolase [Halosegnis longus]|uniref:HAD-IIA family hydrolase n=1 Tax=Halosegnis longus TaxID=2216012 RepID=A0AAJ4UVP5_9EURY|nr:MULTISPECIES: HAD-IIA family hydrolase [Halobacteriales]RNJ26139.1 HAD-IIA family hydrolase [Salella cibi]